MSLIPRPATTASLITPAFSAANFCKAVTPNPSVFNLSSVTDLGALDTPSLLVSHWFYTPSSNDQSASGGFDFPFFGGNESGIGLGASTSNQQPPLTPFSVTAIEAFVGISDYSSFGFDYSTNAGAIIEDGWNHCLWNLDVGFSAGSRVLQLYVNDAPIALPNDFHDVGAAFNFAVAGHPILFAQNVTTDVIYVAECYAAFGQNLDLSVTANRRKFISAGLKPVSLGSDGSLPTGTKPTYYLHVDGTSGVAADFLTNRAGNGDFTNSGDPLMLAPSSPG